MTAKDIAAQLKATRFASHEEAWAATATLREHRDALAAIGASTALHDAVIAAFSRFASAVDDLRRRLRREIEERQSVLDALDRGEPPAGHWLRTQNDHESIVLALDVAEKRRAAHALLDVFAELGDRIEVTPEERAAAIQRAAERSRAALAAAWGKRKRGEIEDAATAHGIPIGLRAATIEALAAAGIAPEPQEQSK